MNNWPLLLLLFLSTFAEARQEARQEAQQEARLEARQVLNVPGDTSMVRLQNTVEFSDGKTRVQADKGTYLVAAKTIERYQLYEATLASARYQLLVSRVKVDTLLSTLHAMEEKLKTMEAVSSGELGEDLRVLHDLQADLHEAQLELKTGNDELAIIKNELGKVQKQLERRSRLENAVRVTIGVAGVAAGLLLGLAF